MISEEFLVFLMIALILGVFISFTMGNIFPSIKRGYKDLIEFLNQSLVYGVKMR